MRFMLRVYNQRKKSPSPTGSRSPNRSPSPRPSAFLNKSPSPDYPEYPDYPQCSGPRARTNVQMRFRRYEEIFSDDDPFCSAGESSAPEPARAFAMPRGDGAADGAKHRDASPGSGDDGSGELGDAKGKAREKDKSDAKSKIIRVLTVMAYVLSVSLAAIMLSLYYVFLWDPKMPSGGAAGRLEADPPAEASFASLSAPAPTDASLSAAALNATEDDAGVTQGLVGDGL